MRLAKANAHPTAPAPSSDALPPDIAVRVEGVSKRFKDFWALRDISFDVRKGECVGIVGFNGAGKSTLLQIIADTLQPTAGSAATQGRVVAMLELGSGFNPEFTGIENLYMNAALMGVPSKVIDEKLEEIKAFAEIGDHIDQPVKTYSSGMTIRLAFSLLTQIDPDLMIIDEALAVGDSYFSHKCNRLIKKYREAGKTFLFVSHSDSAIKSLCDRALLIDKGYLIRDGKPADILDYYGAMVAQKERELEIRQIEKEKGRTVTRSGNGLAKIERFELMNEEREPRRRFDVGAKAVISCVIHAYSEIPAPVIGFMIRDRFGNDVFGTNTYHLQTSARKLTPGEQLEAVFETELRLGPGEYSLTLAAHEGPVHLENSFDWFDRLIVFQILPHRENFFSGVAALPAKVEFSSEISAINRHYELGTRIDFTDTGNSHRYVCEGWDKPERDHTWSNARRSVLQLTLDDAPGGLVLDIELRPFVCPTLPAQEIEIKANGTLLRKAKLSQAERLRLPIPAKIARRELEIEFDLPNAASPESHGLSSDNRLLAIALTALAVRLE